MEYRIYRTSNIASGNYTVGKTADLVRAAVEEMLGIRVALNIKHNYKVSIEKAENILTFHPNHNVKWIVANLVQNLSQFQDWDNPTYYNILTLKALESKQSAVSYTVGAAI
jgi:hypothetical protein